MAKNVSSAEEKTKPITATKKLAKSNDKTVPVNRKGNDKTIPVNKKDSDATIPVSGKNSTSSKADNTLKVTKLKGKKLSRFYEFGKILDDSSGQSIVYLVKNSKDNKDYVCKLYCNEETSIDKEVVNIVAKKINSPFVIRIVDYGTYNGCFYTITPYYKEGSVNEHIEEIDVNKLKKTYIKQLNEGLHAIHKARLIHGDIKPHNILFSNDRKNLIISDFGAAIYLDSGRAKPDVADGIEYMPRRKLEKNNVTEAYLPPEGTTVASAMGDYYSLGLTILAMAYKSDITSKAKDTIVREHNMVRGITVPESVDRQISSLITRMTKPLAAHRIGYDGVKKWCDNPGCFGIGGRLNEITIEDARFEGNRYRSLQEYTDALIENYSAAVEHYSRRELMENLKEAGIDQKLEDKLNKIRRDYSNKLDIALLVTLLTINPNLKFGYDGFVFGDFRGYIAYLDEALVNGEDCFYNEVILNMEIENEIATRKLPSKTNILSIVKDEVFNSGLNISQKRELLRNYFTKKTDIIYKGKVYANTSEFAQLLFGEMLTPSHDELIILYAKLIAKRQTKGIDADAIESILKEQDLFKRNAQLALLLTGNSIPFLISGKRCNNINDVIQYAKEIYEKQLDLNPLSTLIKNGLLLKYYRQYNKPNPKLISLLEELQSYATPGEIVFRFYLNTQENSAFYLGDRLIRDVKDLYVYLGKSENIERDTETIIKSKNFKLWLEQKGYKKYMEAIFKGNSK